MEEVSRQNQKQRPINLQALSRHNVELICVRDTDGGVNVFRFTVVIPTDELSPGKKAKLTPDDENTLQRMFCSDLGGCTRLPKFPGYGLRDAETNSPEERIPELNYNVAFVLYTSPVVEADQYFRALQSELQEALDEGSILIERQEVTLL